MTDPGSFRGSMFVLVAMRADGKWYPLSVRGCLPMFTSGDLAKAYLSERRGLPDGTIVSQESGWERLIGAMQQARDEGTRLVAVDPTEADEAMSIDHAIRTLSSMREQVALPANALLLRCMLSCAERMGRSRAATGPAGAVEILERVVRALRPQGEMAAASRDGETFLRSLAGREAGVSPAPPIVPIPETAIAKFVPWVEARLVLLSPGRGDR